MSKPSWTSMDHQIPSCNLDRGGAAKQWESSFFSSSLSEIFNRKFKLLENDILSHQSVQTATSLNVEEDIADSAEEVEADTVGNLLPGEDDLISALTDEWGHRGHNSHVAARDDPEEFDLFSSIGGLELERDDYFSADKKKLDAASFTVGLKGFNTKIARELPCGDSLSRTLFVRNISNGIEDSELSSLFEQYGDIQTIYTASKHRGFIVVSFYDIRAALHAKKALQNKPLRSKNLDIHFSIPKEYQSSKDINQGIVVIFNLESSVPMDQIHQIFGAYGEIKDIQECSNKCHIKYIEYYDIRAAEAVISSLNGSEIAGKKLKLEPACWSTSRFVEHPRQDRLQYLHCSSPYDNSRAGLMSILPRLSTSCCCEDGFNQMLGTSLQSPVGSLIERHPNSCIRNGLQSPASMASLCNQPDLYELNCSFDDLKFGNCCVPASHSQSLSDRHNILETNVACISPSMVGGMMSMTSSEATRGINVQNIRGMDSNRHQMEFGGVLGSPVNAAPAVHGHQQSWKSFNAYQQSPSNPILWSSSASYVNGVQTHQFQHISGFSGTAPLLMFNPAPRHHHVGSAPAINPSLWERRHAYSGEAPEISSICVNAAASSTAFPGSPSPHSCHDIFSHCVARNCMSISKINGLHSPQNMCHVFPGRSPGASVPIFDAHGERGRNLSHRRNDTGLSQSDKKQYELDISRIVRKEDSRTTLMIKNIPNKYTSKMLLAAIDEHCRGTYDFIYLPIDFKNKCNVGYAFINMLNSQQIIPFYEAFNGKKWEKFNSEKVASLAYARIQGKTALVAHFQNSSLMNEDKRCRPILFHTDGPNAGDPEPFPMGTNTRSRLAKARLCGEESATSAVPNKDDSSNGTDSSGSD